MTGIPSWWITFNPGMMDNPLVVRMLQRKRGEATGGLTIDWANHKRLPKQQERAHLVAKNPFESARAHNTIRDLIWKDLFGLTNAAETKAHA